MWIAIKISLKSAFKGQINNILANVQIMAWRRPGDKPLSKPVMVSLSTQICITRSQRVNALYFILCLNREYITITYILTRIILIILKNMTSLNGNIFRVTGYLCGEFTGHRWIPSTQRPVTRGFDDFFDLLLHKRLSKQSRGWWFETPSRLYWSHCNDASVRHWTVTALWTNRNLIIFIKKFKSPIYICA